MKHSQNKIVLLNIFSTIIIQGINFFVSPIFSRLLGPSNYGVVTVYNTWVSIFSTVLSLQAASTFAIARSNFPEEDQTKYQSSVLSLSALSYVLFSVIILFVCLFFIPTVNMQILIMSLMQGLFVYIIGSVNSKFTYEFKADKNFIIALVLSISNILVSLLFVYNMPKEINYMGRIYGQVISNGIISIILFSLVLRSGKTIYNKEYWKFTLPIAIPTIFHLLASLLLNQSDKLMLQSMNGNSAAGIYGLATNLANVLVVIYGALNNSWVPFFFEYTRNNQIDEIKIHAKNYLQVYTILTCGFILLCPEVYHVFASKEFWEGTSLLPIFALGQFFVFLYSFPVNYEFFHKKTKVIATGTVIAAICNILLNIVFIRMYGMIGAAIATMIAHSLQFFFHYYMAKNKIEGEFPYRINQFIPNILIVFGTIIIAFLLINYALIRWIIGAVIGGYLIVSMYKRKSFF